MIKSYHFWNAMSRAKTFAYIISFHLPLKPVSTGIITPALQIRKLLPREVIGVPQATQLLSGSAGTQPTSDAKLVLLTTS